MKRHGIVVKDRVITSRDPGMSDVRYALRRPDMPPGIHSWQLPIELDERSFLFMTVAEPGAVVPSHSHTRDLFRLVISGSIILDNVELKSGDWMFVPKGTKYSYTAALNPGAVTFHAYC
jgi:quercetin dioxygenase-like cupin family protein